MTFLKSRPTPAAARAPRISVRIVPVNCPTLVVWARASPAPALTSSGTGASEQVGGTMGDPGKVAPVHHPDRSRRPYEGFLWAMTIVLVASGRPRTCRTATRRAPPRPSIRCFRPWRQRFPLRLPCWPPEEGVPRHLAVLGRCGLGRQLLRRAVRRLRPDHQSGSDSRRGMGRCGWPRGPGHRPTSPLHPTAAAVPRRPCRRPRPAATALDRGGGHRRHGRIPGLGAQEPHAARGPQPGGSQGVAGRGGIGVAVSMFGPAPRPWFR